jgi:histidinol-phosphate aminotransferase
MSSSKTKDSAVRPLDALRRDIDAIDDELHFLLQKRAGLVNEVGAAKAREGGQRAPLFRPGREAGILRRLLARNQDPLPAELVARIWREIIASLTRLQGRFEVGVFAPRAEPRWLDIARQHFGAATVRPMMSLPSLMSAVARGKVSLAVVPAPGKGVDWWTNLPKGMNVLARLPFLVSRRDGDAGAVVIGRQDFESSGDDRFLITVTTGGTPKKLQAALKAARLGDAKIIATVPKGRGRRCFLVDAAKQPVDLGDDMNVRVLGGYARPVEKDARAKSKQASSALQVRPGIMQIAPYVQGIQELPGHETTIKLSSNEGALGPSPAAVAAIRNAAVKAHRYPDGGSEKLRAAIGKRFGLAPDRIVCGTGSDELIALLCRAYAGPGDEILYTEHGFSMYPLLTLSAGATPVTAKETNYRTDVDALIAKAGPRTKACFVANPNNPTGTYISADEMKRLRDGLPPACLLVVDSAYAEYVSANDYSAGVELVDGRDDTVMLRTFSKMFGLGGMRVGWAYCPPAIADVLNRIRGTFNISSVSQAAAIAALEDTAFVERSRAHNDQWLQWLTNEVKALGLDVVPSVANFLLIGFPAEGAKTAAAAEKFLNSRGIIPRGVRGYGLPNHLRITIGTEAEMRAVVAALTDFLK